MPIDNQDKKIQGQMKSEETDSIMDNILKSKDEFLGKKTIDTSVLYSSIAKYDIAKRLEQSYLNGELGHDKIVDTKNFPQNSPDMSTWQILDILFSENRLPFRQVSYCIFEFPDGSMCVTDVYKEYSYEDRKFIRVLATQDEDGNIILSNNDQIENSKFYWIEVKSRDLSKDKIYTETDTFNNGRKM